MCSHWNQRHLGMRNWSFWTSSKWYFKKYIVDKKMFISPQRKLSAFFSSLLEKNSFILFFSTNEQKDFFWKKLGFCRSGHLTYASRRKWVESDQKVDQSVEKKYKKKPKTLQKLFLKCVLTGYCRINNKGSTILLWQ